MKSAAFLMQWSCVYAEKMEHIFVCLSVYVCVHTSMCGGGGGSSGGEYSSVWLNQTFFLSPAMVSDDEWRGVRSGISVQPNSYKRQKKVKAEANVLSANIVS